MAGSGSRLGMPYHKALSPVLTDAGIRPLYSFAFERLRAVATRVIFVLSTEGIADPCLADLPGERMVKPRQGELPTSLALVARTLHPDTLCAVALPDSIWHGDMNRLVARYLIERDPMDGVMGLFQGPCDVLDRVDTDKDWIRFVNTRSELTPENGRTNCRDCAQWQIAREGPPYVVGGPPASPNQHPVTGWGCFIATAGCLRGLTDDRPIGPQLGEYRFAAVTFDSSYLDLGTPDRYATHHDQRTQ